MWKIINRHSTNNYYPLNQNKLLPNSNIPQLSFSNLTNIFNIVSPANTQILHYNIYVGLFENTSINSSFLSDFNISTASSDCILQYLNMEKWINATMNFTLSSESDVSLNNLSNGQLLQYNSSSSKWNNISPTYISSCSINATNGANANANFTNTSSYRIYNINYGLLYQFYSLVGVYQVLILAVILCSRLMVEL